MRKLVLLALVGLAAQLVDGSLGMGYGMTSSSLLLLAGLSPALASASVHLAEIGTTLATGGSATPTPAWWSGWGCPVRWGPSAAPRSCLTCRPARRPR